MHFSPKCNCFVSNAATDFGNLFAVAFQFVFIHFTELAKPAESMAGRESLRGKGRTKVRYEAFL